MGPPQSEVEAALVRVAQGRDLPGAVVAAQRDHPRQQRHGQEVIHKTTYQTNLY